MNKWIHEQMNEWENRDIPKILKRPKRKQHRRPHKELMFELCLEEWKLLLQERASSDSIRELFLAVGTVRLAFHCFGYCHHPWYPASENPAPPPDC